MMRDNGGDDGKYFIEGRAQFTIEDMEASDFVTKAYWDDEDYTPLTDQELDNLAAYFPEFLDMEYRLRKY